MKKIFKRLGVLGLITAILLPFLELPMVNAETQTDGCEYNLNNYLFLDSEIATGLKYYDSEYDDETKNIGYVTFANFPYTFPEDDNKKVEVTKVDIKNITSENQLKMFWQMYDEIIRNDAKNDIFYKEYGKDQNQFGIIFNSTSGKYDKNTILIHGVWGKYDEDGDIEIEETDWSDVEEGYDNSLQSIFTNEFKDKDAEMLDAMKIKIRGALNKGAEDFEEYKGDYTLTEYFNAVINEQLTTNPVWSSSSNKKYLPLQISRTIDDSDMKHLDDYTFGYVKDKEDKYFIFSEKELTSDGKATNSYTAMQKYYEDKTKYEAYFRSVDEDKFKVDFVLQYDDGDYSDKDGAGYVNYYWPFVLNVEYKVCPISNSETPTDPGVEKPAIEEWTIKYNANVTDNSVTNIPKSQTKHVGINITLDSLKPSRDGYTFKKWCENKDGSGECYNPGDTIESPKERTEKNLYAQWGKLDAEENKKTGVVSYILGFTAVGIVASGIYLISKKKNLFKQI